MKPIEHAVLCVSLMANMIGLTAQKTLAQSPVAQSDTTVKCNGKEMVIDGSLRSPTYQFKSIMGAGDTYILEFANNHKVMTAKVISPDDNVLTASEVKEKQLDFNNESRTSIFLQYHNQAAIFAMLAENRKNLIFSAMGMNGFGPDARAIDELESRFDIEYNKSQP